MSMSSTDWRNPYHAVTETRFTTTAGADAERLMLRGQPISLSLDLVNFIGFQRQPDKAKCTRMFCCQVTLIVAIGGADHMLVGRV